MTIEEILKKDIKGVQASDSKYPNKLTEDVIKQFINTEIEAVVRGMAGEEKGLEKTIFKRTKDEKNRIFGYNQHRQQGLDWARDNLGINIK